MTIPAWNKMYFGTPHHMVSIGYVFQNLQRWNDNHHSYKKHVAYNLCSLSQWCPPTISSYVVPFSSCLQSFPASVSFQMSQLFSVFSNESALHIRWPKYWSFSFNISPSNEHPGLISLRMDCLDLLAVQGTLKNLLQHHCSKASIL